MEAESLWRMPTGGCTERLLSKYLQNIVPQFLTESAAYVGINRHLDGWMASWLRTRILFTYYSSSTQASIVFSEFYLNVSLISDVQIENQDHCVWENACEKKTVPIKKKQKNYSKVRCFHYTF